MTKWAVARLGTIAPVDFIEPNDSKEIVRGHCTELNRMHMKLNTGKLFKLIEVNGGDV